MTSTPSLRRRLITWMAAANVLVLAAAAALYLWRSSGLQGVELTDLVKHLAAEAVLGVETTPDGLALTPAIVDEARRAGVRGLAVIDTATNTVAKGSDPQLAVRVGPLVALGLARGALVYNEENGNALGVVVLSAETSGGRRTAVVSFTGQSRWDWFYHELTSDVLPIFLPLLFATLLTSSVIVRRGLAPVAAVSLRAAELAPTALDVRLKLEGVPSEITPLISAFNGALDRVEAGFESQRRFTADAAHELRTPLAVLKARSDSIGEGELKKAISADIDRMALLVDRLLAIARMEARQIPTDEDVDLASVAASTISQIFPLAHSRGRDIAFEHDGVLAVIKGNAASLSDALRNVIENAIRATPEGTTVEVRLEGGSRLSVLDSGLGVNPAERGSIFQPFRRASGSMGGSAGLGLAIAAEVARLHGGTLSVGEREGGGACFTFDFSRSPPVP